MREKGSLIDEAKLKMKRVRERIEDGKMNMDEWVYRNREGKEEIEREREKERNHSYEKSQLRFKEGMDYTLMIFILFFCRKNRYNSKKAPESGETL